MIFLLGSAVFVNQELLGLNIAAGWLALLLPV
jgi:hypothetical protein